MLDYNKIGKFIALKREEKGLTQLELANTLFVTRQAVSKWERGLAIPDYEQLLKLCEIFGVTVNELLAGEMKTKANEKNIDNMAIDVLQDSKKRQKKLIILFSAIIFLILVLFLIYYFFSTYNKLHVYLLSGTSENFILKDTLAVISNERAYIEFSKVYSEQYEPTYIKVYYKMNDEIKLLYSTENDNNLIIQDKGYNDYFDFKDITTMLENLYIDITYKINNEEKVETIKFDVRKIYSNDNLLFKDVENIGTEKINVDNNEVPKLMDDLHLNKDGNYELKYKEENKDITFFYSIEAEYFSVTETDNKYSEIFIKWLNSDSFSYKILDNNDEIVSESDYIDDSIDCFEGDCSNHLEKYDYFKEKYINKYFQ